MDGTCITIFVIFVFQVLFYRHVVFLWSHPTLILTLLECMWCPSLTWHEPFSFCFLSCSTCAGTLYLFLTNCSLLIGRTSAANQFMHLLYGTKEPLFIRKITFLKWIVESSWEKIAMLYIIYFFYCSMKDELKFVPKDCFCIYNVN